MWAAPAQAVAVPQRKGIKVAGLAAVFALVKPGLLDDVASLHQLVQRPFYRRDAIAALGGYGLDGWKTLALLVTNAGQGLESTSRASAAIQRKIAPSFQ